MTTVKSKSVKSGSANPSIELLTLYSEDSTVLRVASEWYELRPDKLTADQMAVIVESTDVDELRAVVMAAQTYKVERIRHELIAKLNELNEELGKSTRMVGFCNREDDIKRVFRPLDGYDTSPGRRQTTIIERWRDLRKRFKELDKLPKPERDKPTSPERLEKIKEIFKNV